MTQNETVQKRIQLAVKYCGISQQKLADMMETSQAQVSSWATGKTLPSLTTFARLAEALEKVNNINPLWLLGLSERREL